MVSSITVPGNRCSKGVSLLWRTRSQGSLHRQHWTFQQFECCVQHASEERTFSTCVSVNLLNQSMNVYIRSSFLTSSCMWLCVNRQRQNDQKRAQHARVCKSMLQKRWIHLLFNDLMNYISFFFLFFAMKSVTKYLGVFKFIIIYWIERRQPLFLLLGEVVSRQIESEERVWWM